MEGFSRKWYERGKGLGLKNGPNSTATKEWRAIKGRPKAEPKYGEAMASFSAGYLDGLRQFRKKNPAGGKPVARNKFVALPEGAKRVKYSVRRGKLFAEFR